MMSPQEFLQQYLGWGKDVNGAAGIQCVDLAKEHFRLVGVPNYTAPIGGDGYSDNIWYNRERWATWYDFIPAGHFQDGDMVVFPHQKRGGWTHPYSHVCFWYGGQEFGTNQGVATATLKSTDWSDALGALRYKGWNKKATLPDTSSDIEINGHKYSLYKQSEDMYTVVLSAGIDHLASIRNLDADVYVVAKVTGGNYFQMRTDLPDNPYGETYGDLSAPLNDVWMELPNQDSTLYYDIETGLYGDCTGVHIDRTHNVFSPAVVYPQSGNYQYARMVGIDHVNTVSRYTFVVQLADGTYALGIALQDLTPKQIAEDFRSAYCFRSLAFLDGGGSAQMCRWVNNHMEYIHETGRECPSAVAIVCKRPYEIDVPVIVPQPEPEPVEPDVPDAPEEPEPDKPEKEDEPMESKPIENWKDPDNLNYELNPFNVILLNLANLFKVKSILTFALTGAYIALLFSNIEVPKFLETILTMVIGFYYGTQFTKPNGGGKTDG